jgi:dihydroflavonol-4-reductase
VGSPSQILISGATGFVGRYLVRALLERQESVRILVRNEKTARLLFGNRVTYAEGDLRQKESLADPMKGVTTLYHVGGLYAFGRNHARALMEVNVLGTEHLLAAAAQADVSKVVHISSAGLLARSKGTASETTFPKVQPRGRPYKSSKWLAEQVVLNWVKKGLPVVIANPTCPLGPEDNTPTGQIIRDFLKGRFFLSSRTGLNFLDCRDLAQGLIACAKHGRVGERYVLGQHNLMLSDFLRILARETGLPGPRGEVPWPLIAAGALVSECLMQMGLRKIAGRPHNNPVLFSFLIAKRLL